MDNWPAVGIAVGVVTGLVALFFRSPNDQIKTLDTRIALLETEFDTLKVLYAGNHGRHDQALSALTVAVTRLTDRFDQFMQQGGHGRQR